MDEKFCWILILYIGGDNDDYIHTTKYEMFLGQLIETENSVVILPPASNSFIKNLPMVLLDIRNDVGLFFFSLLIWDRYPEQNYSIFL